MLKKLIINCAFENEILLTNNKKSKLTRLFFLEVHVSYTIEVCNYLYSAYSYTVD